MTKNKKATKYTCIHCGHTSSTIGIVQKEIHYYTFLLDTKQFEDMDGSDSVSSQKCFCLKYNKTYKVDF